MDRSPRLRHSQHHGLRLHPSPSSPTSSPTPRRNRLLRRPTKLLQRNPNHPRASSRVVAGCPTTKDDNPVLCDVDASCRLRESALAQTIRASRSGEHRLRISDREPSRQRRSACAYKLDLQHFASLAASRPARTGDAFPRASAPERLFALPLWRAWRGVMAGRAKHPPLPPIPQPPPPPRP